MQCNEKVKYQSKEAAQAQIAYLLRESQGAMEPLQAYKCPKCRNWHLAKWFK